MTLPLLHLWRRFTEKLYLVSVSLRIFSPGTTSWHAYYGNALITFSGALALAIGIAIQNFPEGAVISLPLKGEGVSKPKSFLLGVISGIVEPIAAVVTILLIKYIEPILPYLLSFAAGAMIYVVVEELIPEAQAKKHSNWATIALSLGCTLMMVLDVALG